MKNLVLALILMGLLASCAKNITVLNKGIGGNNSQDLLRRLERDVLAESPDLVILMTGSNDMINSRKFISYATFRENYQSLISRMKAQGIEVVVMSPPPVDTGYVFQRHNRALFQQEPNDKLDSLNHLIEELAKANGVHYLNLHQAFRERGTPNRSAQSLLVNQANMGIPDGLHPTREGYQLIAGEVYRYLKAHKLLKRKQKILCFGDSITYGAFMTGKGTTEGDTYPALLRQLLLP